MTTSKPVAKTVAKNLKYYFEVKRLEEGFDLTNGKTPTQDRPPNKARPTLQYDGLHDRSLKHYFSQPEVRVQLTQLGLADSKKQTPRERSIKNSLTKDMKKHNFLKPNIPSCFHIYTYCGPTLRPSTAAFGASPPSQKTKTMAGGWPALRSVPPANVSRGEAQRVVHSASKLLAAANKTEHVRTRSENQRSANRPPEKLRAASARRRPRTAKYTWDRNGHCVPASTFKAYDDSYLDRIPRRAYLRRSPPPSAKAVKDKSSRITVTPTPPPPKSPVQTPARVKRQRPPTQRQGTLISSTSEQIKDEEMDEVKQGPIGEYQVYVKTGDRAGASTTAAVNLTIYGEKGCTPAIHLAISKYNKVKFQRGKEDLFIGKAHHVGQIMKVKIGHDRPQLSYAWYLESLKIHDMMNNQMYSFPCHRWLSGQDEDEQTYVTFLVDPPQTSVDDSENSATYLVSQRSESRADSKSSDAGYYSATQKKDHANIQASKKGENKDEKIRRPASSTRESSRKARAQKISSSETQKKPDDPDYQKKEEVKKNMDKRGKDLKPQPVEEEFLAGYKAGLEAVEVSERKKKEDERTQDRELLNGPSIHDACHSGDLERVTALLEKFPEMKDLTDENGWTPLHLAAGSGHTDIIKRLMSAGCYDLDIETPTGYTPTHLAALNGRISTVMVLNALGADLGCETVDKQTPLHLAARAGHLECVKCLVANRAQLGVEDGFGRTPLELADEYGQTEIVSFLQACEQDLANPSSTLAQLHQGGMPFTSQVTKNEKNNSGSDREQPVRVMTDQKAKAKEEQVLQEKRTLYEEQHRHMEERGVSFLDSIRQDFESES